MRSPSPNRLWLLVLSTLVAGCPAEAPPLPPDTTSINRTHDLTLDDFTPTARAMTCEQITAERTTITSEMRQATDKIAANRSRNETAVGLAYLVGLPALLATDNNTTEKNEITALYKRQDTLIELAGLKHCSTPP